MISRFGNFGRLYFSSSSKAAVQVGQKSVVSALDTFPRRHLGSDEEQKSEMLKYCGLKSMSELIDKAIPSSIMAKKQLSADSGLSEKELIVRLKQIGQMNKIFKSYIGMGYYNCILPPVIQRNILENPQWYTQYTPYQPEISQGRLESLINFQTMVTELTGMSIANASLLDEGTAAAEAMLMCFSAAKRAKTSFFVDEKVHPQTISCLKTRALGFGIDVIVGDVAKFDFEKGANVSGIMLQYPDTDGRIFDMHDYVQRAHKMGAQVVCATDLLALTVLKPPGEFGCDIVFGNSQRFGVPFGYGGPHAAFFACSEENKRRMPGRLVGVSKDAAGNKAYRLSLQTREQHIRREKATSNICTAQALLANISAMYAVYHGPKGLKDIATRTHSLACILAEGIKQQGHSIRSKHFFDTVTVDLKTNSKDVVKRAEGLGINIRQVGPQAVAVSVDETVNEADLQKLLQIFSDSGRQVPKVADIEKKLQLSLDKLANVPEHLIRSSEYLSHPVFNSFHTETEMLRYISRLQAKDLSLANAMIPLGSCTMKLNATTEMIPVTWPEFSDIHPFVPAEQAEGYKVMMQELESDLAEITGLDSVSLQPNSGAQGEYAGLCVIRAYLDSIGERQRNVCLIPTSAHGTNPASASMAGMDVVAVKCDTKGNLDMEDLQKKLHETKGKLAAIMITYPSTYGFFDEGVEEICQMVHDHGGQVYLDGANLNAQVGLCRPGDYGADVCHMNLHKTFCIPHGGGGPGMGPIAVKKHLQPFLPNHPIVSTSGSLGIGPISAAPWGSASILPISWSYIKMMGGEGLAEATRMAILNANYMAKRLEDHYKILFTNKNGMCAHEFIVDARPFAASAGVEAIDIAKRLQDYGFHSPTMSWPVGNTLMIEPTESESKDELDRFCDAMISIREEIREIEDGKQPKDNNVLLNAPHTMETLLSSEWKRPYSREKAAYPLQWLRPRYRGKFWPSVSRLDDTFGDRNLVCSCPPIEDY